MALLGELVGWAVLAIILGVVGWAFVSTVIGWREGWVEQRRILKVLRPRLSYRDTAGLRRAVKIRDFSNDAAKIGEALNGVSKEAVLEFVRLIATSGERSIWENAVDKSRSHDDEERRWLSDHLWTESSSGRRERERLVEIAGDPSQESKASSDKPIGGSRDEAIPGMGPRTLDEETQARALEEISDPTAISRIFSEQNRDENTGSIEK